MKRMISLLAAFRRSRARTGRGRSAHGYFLAFALLAAALALAGCLGPRPPTALGDNLASACIEARGAHRAFGDFCDIRRNCQAEDIAQADGLRGDADKLCSPPAEDTALHRAAVRAIAAQLQALGR